MAKVEGTAGAQSQLQTASSEGEQQKKDTDAKRKTAEVGGEGAEVQFFDCTVMKIDADGNEVMSDHVGPGEKLVSAVRAEEEEAALKARRRDADRNDRDNK